jgi:alpha-1,2-mannosyltransferase
MGNKCLSFAYANSTWTFNHLNKLWRELYNKQKLFILYPPCSISLYKEAAKNDNRQNIIVSFAQFRPEKRQEVQIKILKELRDRLSKYGINDLELHIIGGVRNKSDQEILDKLVKYAQLLGVQDYVKFLPNGKTSEILEEFAQAKIGIHTMKYEHFGITLIEMMAAGLIIVTHNSAGAKDDILVYDEETNCNPGFLVETEEDYVNQIEEILVKYYEIRNQIVNSSTKRAEKFSDDAFKKQFLEQFNDFLL